MGTIIIAAVVFVVLGLSVAVGVAASAGRQHISEDYFLAGKSLPWYVVALSLAGLSLRLELWLGFIGLCYAAGLAGGGLAWGGFVGLSVLAWVFLPYFVRKRLYSPAEFIQRRYSPSTRGLVVVLAIVFLLVGVLVPALYTGGWLLSEAVFNVPLIGLAGVPWVFFACVAGLALVAAVAGVGGGAMAGAWGGAVQMLFVVVGGAVFAAVAVHGGGGLADVLDKNGPARGVLLLSSHNELLPWLGMAAFALTIGLWNSAASPLAVQRCLGARSEWDARMGTIVAGLLVLAFPAIFVLPGLAAVVKLGPLGNNGLAPEQGAMKLIEGLFGRQSPLAAAGQGLVVAAMLSAVLSTLTAAVHGISTLWTMDICQDLRGMGQSESELVRRGRRASLVTIILAALLTPALLGWENGILDFVLEVSAIVGPPLAVAFVVGFFWSQAHGRSAVAAIVAGCLTAGALWFLAANATEALPDWLRPVVNRAGVTGLASLVVLVLGSLAIPASSGELYDPDAAWGPELSRLPPHERDAGSGLGNLVVWWGVMIAASIGVWIWLK